MIKNITAAYVGLIGIFGCLLVIGSVKTIMYPDENVYSPGKIVTLYNPQMGEFTQISPVKNYANITPKNSFFQASMFQDNIDVNSLCEK
jgi:hypothetical protein